MLNREQIQRRVPHSEAMCLLDSVQHWDATTIDCRAAAPTTEHPLARASVVPAIAALEYAAQAAAVHGSLLDASATPRAGLLAKLSDVELAPQAALRPAEALSIHAELLVRAAAGCLYSFEVSQGRGLVARGRLMVAFQAGATR
jgi:predicted hotdog family 3-hydroxylacyl-ACP dehydratase